jgi:hypothetical protein
VHKAEVEAKVEVGWSTGWAPLNAARGTMMVKKRIRSEGGGEVNCEALCDARLPFPAAGRRTCDG